MASLVEVSDIIASYLKEKGSAKAQYTVTERETREITLENGEFTLFRTLFDNDVEIEVIKDHKIGKTSINKFDEMAIKNALDTAFVSAESGSADEAYDIAPKMEPAVFHIGVEEPDVDQLMQRAQEFVKDIKERYPKILIMQIILTHVKEHSLYRNSNGSQDETFSGYYSIVAEYAGNDGENSTGIGGCVAVTKNLDTPFIELGNIDYNLKVAQDSLELTTVEGKFQGDVIFTPECMSQMLGYTVTNFIDDNVLIAGTSMWKDKLEQKVASDLFTLEYKPWDERIVSHEVHTADGFRSEDFVVIKDGVLKSFGASLYGANKCNVERAKCSEYDFVVEPGDTELSEMIKSVKKGLIIGAISCGVPSANGEISGVAKNSFYVENGEIKGAVMETMVSFTLPEMLQNIVEISKEAPLDGTCVMPFIKVKNINISGK